LDELFNLQDALDTTRTRSIVALGAHEKGEGPILENPEDVRAYLQSISIRGQTDESGELFVAFRLGTHDIYKHRR
jgi:hypothetical protein